MKKLDVPKVFVDETSSRILIAALSRPRTALEIRRVTGVPVAPAFYRIKLLEKRGLLSRTGEVLDRDGRAVPLYRSNLYHAYFFVDSTGKLRVRFQLVADSQEDVAADESALV